PEEASEGMNRLAEAFITLTEACSKEHNGAAVSAKEETKTQPDWRAEPPPVREETADAPEPIAEEETGKDEVMVAKPFAPPTKLIRRVIDPALLRDLAEESDEATSNLATLDRVIARVDHTRLVLHAWDQLGKLLKKAPAKKISPKESEL